MTPNEIKFFNDKHVAKIKRKIFEYNEDGAKKIRRNLHICKYCYYINTGRIAGQAFSSATCKECGKEMIFPTTDTNEYCPECAKKLNVCEHCGSEMD